MERKNKKTILVVFEARSSLVSLNAFMNLSENREYIIKIARSDKDVVNIIQAHSPDVILLDDAILEIEGEQVISGILGFKNCPVILMTPYISSDSVPRFMEMGCYGCIRKVFETHSMNSIIARAIVQQGHPLR
ncbi:MAG: response regulator [Candidatus Gracilibacteria bacterium]|nr:response regulator [Candidatus Gracilibacteria bacterium]